MASISINVEMFLEEPNTIGTGPMIITPPASTFPSFLELENIPINKIKKPINIITIPITTP